MAKLSHKFEIETKQDSHEQHLNSVLTIHDARVDDSGRYRCIYDNIQESVQVKVFNDGKFYFSMILFIFKISIDYVFFFNLKSL
jgi:hypothetical protein